MKNLDYSMKLPYRMEIEPIPENEGGGYCVSIPQLGRYALRADGETPDEALRNLEDVKRDLFASYLEEGVEIPEPEPDEEAYSGKFLVRIPRTLHRELALKAKENRVSLNQFVAFLLARGCEIEKHGSTFGRASVRPAVGS